MYEVDPFAARKAVDERQATLAAKREAASKPIEERGNRSGSSSSSEFANAPEVKMSTALRDSVEQSIKKVCGSYD